MIHAGVGERQINSILSELNIPPVSHCMLDSRRKEIGKAVEEVADNSMFEAIQEEITMKNENR